MADKGMSRRGCRVQSGWGGGGGFFFLACCVIFLSGHEACLAATSYGENFSAQVVKVIDGDTIEVRYQEKKLRIRLWGIDTPEHQQGFSREAQEFTRQRIQGRGVELQTKAWDKYGRLVAIVNVDGDSLNEELLREGLAWVHIYYCKEPICREWRQLEKKARQGGRGLWQDTHPVPPWKWKQNHR
jgi:endonuclease YncB( thermonuclease family)